MAEWNSEVNNSSNFQEIQLLVFKVIEKNKVIKRKETKHAFC